MKSVRLPDHVYQQVSELAASDQVSVDKLVASLVIEPVGDWYRVKDRAGRGSIERLQHVLVKVSNIPAETQEISCSGFVSARQTF